MREYEEQWVKTMLTLVAVPWLILVVVTSYSNIKVFALTDEVVNSEDVVKIIYTDKELVSSGLFRSREKYVVDYEYKGEEYTKEIERKTYRRLKENSKEEVEVSEYLDKKGNIVKVDIEFNK